MKWRAHFGWVHDDPEPRWTEDISAVIMWGLIIAMGLILLAGSMRAPAGFWGG